MRGLGSDSRNCMGAKFGINRMDKTGNGENVYWSLKNVSGQTGKVLVNVGWPIELPKLDVAGFDPGRPLQNP